MASLGDKTGPYSIDYNIVEHRGNKITTILNSKKFDYIIENLEDFYEYDIGIVPIGYEHRLDLISNVFYNTPKNWWLLMLVNNIEDPFEGFLVSEEIVIPKI